MGQPSCFWSWRNQTLRGLYFLSSLRVEVETNRLARSLLLVVLKGRDDVTSGKTAGVHGELRPDSLSFRALAVTRCSATLCHLPRGVEWAHFRCGEQTAANLGS